MKSALLIIDVQAALCSGEWAAYDVRATVDRINERLLGGQGPPVPQCFSSSMKRVTDPFNSRPPGWQLYERLEVQPDDIPLRKTATDSFHRTELRAHLQSRGVQRLVVCGLQSEFCVDSTVRGALALGYPVVLVADGHSTLDNDVISAAQISAHHNVTLANLSSFGPRVTTTPADSVRIET